MVVNKPLILVLCSREHTQQMRVLRATLDRLGALRHIIDVDDLQRLSLDERTRAIEDTAALACKADGLMVMLSAKETKHGRRIADACREAASRIRRPRHNRLEPVPELVLGSGSGGIGEERAAAWIDTWCDRNRPTGILEAQERRDARRRSLRREDDLPYVWTEIDELHIRNVETGELAAKVHLDLSVCANAGDIRLDARGLTEKLDDAFEAYRATQNERQEATL